MSFPTFVLTLLFLLAIICIIAGIILTWANGQRQKPDARPKEDTPINFPLPRQYCGLCHWTTRPVKLYSGYVLLTGMYMEPSPLCLVCADIIEQEGAMEITLYTGPVISNISPIFN